jgi:hypothetical protein
MKMEAPVAPIDDLSPTERAALIECGDNGCLYKKHGVWRGSSAGMDISGNTIANLGRDGFLIVTKNGRSGSATLTERGEWFARTLLSRANKLME